MAGETQPGRRPEAVLFDLDGTLVESLPDIAESLNELWAEQGWDGFAPEAVGKMVGGGVPKLVERALKARKLPDDPATQKTLSDRFSAIYAPRAARLSRPFPGVVDFLKLLKGAGIALGVVTNKPEAITRRMLEELGLLPLLGAVVGGDTLATTKPDAAPVLAALSQLGAAPENAVMIGDSPADAGAARNAGIPVILVSFGYTQVPVGEIDADGIVDAFIDLPAAMKRIGYAI